MRSVAVSDGLQSRQRLAAAIGLFFLSPLIAEFLLGNLPIKLLPALIVLAPMYGGGALLIRECARRAGRGWPTIVMLALTYGIVEEAFTTQTLFNPNYLHLNAHLLDPGYIPALGIGAWWTVFVLTLHTAWSVSASIALVEGSVPAAATTPWLGRVGLTVTTVLFVLGAVASTLMGYKQDHFLASPAQFASAAVICIVLVFMAFRIPRSSVIPTSSAPSAWVAGLTALLAGSAVLLIPKAWGWWAAACVFALDVFMVAVVLFWSRSPGWNLSHKLALGSGAALAYAWHAFLEMPAVGQAGLSLRIGNAIFAAGAVALIATAFLRVRRELAKRGSAVSEPTIYAGRGEIASSSPDR